VLLRIPGWIVLLALSAAGPLAAGERSSVSEYEVKAAFLFNFAKFTTWPAEDEREGPLRICIAGGDPFGSLLDTTVQDKQVRGRAFRVERFGIEDDLTGCEIVFVGEVEPEARRHLLESLDGSPVLTVGESGSFAEQGGIVEFFQQKRRVRFMVNVDAVERSQLRVSSKLLQLAGATRKAP
jgi:hypothetical protein